MALPSNVDARIAHDDDGLNLTNCGYAILLVLSYVVLVPVFAGAMAGHG